MYWHIFFGVLSGLIAAGMIIPYLVSMVKETTRPNIVSWSLWTIVVFITGLAQIHAGASWSLLLLIGTIAANISVIFLCIRGYGYKKFETIDQITLVCALVSIILWWITANPLAAMICALVADSIAYAPTLIKAYKYPESETLLYWGALVIADLLALISVTNTHITNILFPIVYGSLNIVVVLVLLLGKRKLAHKK